MILAVFVTRPLEVLFFIGLAGATLVVPSSSIQDFKELFAEG
jgi:hypothetical protein